jgi:hypothetical protein
MSPMRLAVLGAGSVRCSPAVVASLANYFGERPVEICLYDADEERLDLFSRFAKVCCTITRSQHLVCATADLDEALEAVDLLIVQVGENCARKFLKTRTDLLGGFPLELEERERVLTVAIKAMVPESLIAKGSVLSLVRESAPDALPMSDTIVGWPPEIEWEVRYKVAHQVLRWVRGDEHPGEWLSAFDRTPLREWLDSSIASMAGTDG